MTVLLHEDYIVERGDFKNAGKVSSTIKEKLKRIGIDAEILRRISIACGEAEINMLIHAWGGDISMDVSDDGTVRFVFKDPGPGIPDLDDAMTPGYSTASDDAREMGFGAGMGLPNIKKVSDSFDIASSPEGTTITLGFHL